MVMVCLKFYTYKVYIITPHAHLETRKTIYKKIKFSCSLMTDFFVNLVVLLVKVAITIIIVLVIRQHYLSKLFV